MHWPTEVRWQCLTQNDNMIQIKKLMINTFARSLKFLLFLPFFMYQLTCKYKTINAETWHNNMKTTRQEYTASQMLQSS